MIRGSGRTTSAWVADVDSLYTTPIDRDLEVDVCVVGAGIAGLSVAYQLARAGRSVVVLEDGPVGSGETSRTTAHLSNAFDDRYSHVERVRGAAAARALAESHTAAIDALERIVTDERIDCGFERLDGYLVRAEDRPEKELEDELAACHRAGLTDVAWASAPIPALGSGRCLRFPRQAQFHPMRFLVGLATAFQRLGGILHTGTHATTIRDARVGELGLVVTRNGPAVRAKDVVVATNTPVQDRVTMHTKQAPYRTYVVALRVPRGTVPRALFWDTGDPYHYVRLSSQGEEQLLIVGGEDHKTGQPGDEHDRFEQLIHWTRERFPMASEAAYRWSGQVQEPMDTIAFIGRNPGDHHVWIVTGDSGNGMTHGALAGMLLRELIVRGDHRWAKLYAPSRVPVRALPEYVRENVNVAVQYGKWLAPGDVSRKGEISRGFGAVMRHGSRKLAIYCDEDGCIHTLSARCPHLGAQLVWNEAEGTWDCPAHGSRFDPYGRVVTGPANGDMTRVSRDAEHRDGGRAGRGIGTDENGAVNAPGPGGATPDRAQDEGRDRPLDGPPLQPLLRRG